MAMNMRSSESRIAPMVVCALTLALLSGCAARNQQTVTGTAQASEWLNPGQGRQEAILEATREAHRQMVAIAREQPSYLGSATIGELMSQSPYVTARVRLAIQRARVLESTFAPDGSARVVKELDIDAIRRAANDAWAETK